MHSLGRMYRGHLEVGSVPRQMMATHREELEDHHLTFLNLATDFINERDGVYAIRKVKAASHDCVDASRTRHSRAFTS